MVEMSTSKISFKISSTYLQESQVLEDEASSALPRWKATGTDE